MENEIKNLTELVEKLSDKIEELVSWTADLAVKNTGSKRDKLINCHNTLSRLGHDIDVADLHNKQINYNKATTGINNATSFIRKGMKEIDEVAKAFQFLADTVRERCGTGFFRGLFFLGSEFRENRAKLLIGVGVRSSRQAKICAPRSDGRPVSVFTYPVTLAPGTV